MPYTQYTRSQLRAMLQQRWNSTPFWSTTEANQAINDALRVWSLLTGYWTTRIAVHTVADTPILTLPSLSLTQQTALSWYGEPLLGVTLSELQLMVPNWWQARAGVGDAPDAPICWAPIGFNLVALYPAPVEVATITADGLRLTPILESDGAYVDLGQEELDTLIGYALHSAALKAGTRLLTRTLPGLQAFMAAAAARNQLLYRTTWHDFEQISAYSWTLTPSSPRIGQPGSALPQAPQDDGS